MHDNVCMHAAVPLRGPDVPVHLPPMGDTKSGHRQAHFHRSTRFKWTTWSCCIARVVGLRIANGCAHDRAAVVEELYGRILKGSSLLLSGPWAPLLVRELFVCERAFSWLLPEAVNYDRRRPRFPVCTLLSPLPPWILILATITLRNRDGRMTTVSFAEPFLLPVCEVYAQAQYQVNAVQIRDLGAGNFGVCQLMVDLVDGEHVAVKFLPRGHKVCQCITHRLPEKSPLTCVCHLIRLVKHYRVTGCFCPHCASGDCTGHCQRRHSLAGKAFATTD